MARTELTAIDLPSVNSHWTGTALTWTTADNVNKDYVDLTGREILLIRNDNAGVQTVTIHSAPDAHGREKDCVFTDIAAAAYGVAGPFIKDGWDNGGQLHIDGAAADVMYAILRLNSSWSGR